jgi:hypothetical protein
MDIFDIEESSIKLHTQDCNFANDIQKAVYMIDKTK